MRIMAKLKAEKYISRSKSADDFLDQPFDDVVLVCDDSNADCPFLPGGRNYNHHPFEDPEAFTGKDKEVLACFRRSRDTIREWIGSDLMKKE